MAPPTKFGTAPGGETVQRITITGGGLTASVITWGAVLQDLRLEGHEPSLVCGFATFDPYPDQSPDFGATPGRVTNRIGNGRFTLEGTTHHLDTNVGPHTLHGGASGYGRRVWEIADFGTSHVDLVLHDPAGTAGFPGSVDAVCSYTLKEDGVLHVALSTSSDELTITNLTHHSYFDLTGDGDIRDHVLQVHANTRLPVDDDFIPTGEPISIDGTGWDFREPRRVGDAVKQLSDAGDVLDHNLCLADTPRGLQHIASVTSPAGGITMDVATTEPGLQIYAAHKAQTDAAGNNGKPYQPFCGLCLEPQLWPDAANRPGFPTTILRPGEVRRQVSTYRFHRA
jgi:aldose 1-epimerase